MHRSTAADRSPRLDAGRARRALILSLALASLAPLTACGPGAGRGAGQVDVMHEAAEAAEDEAQPEEVLLHCEHILSSEQAPLTERVWALGMTLRAARDLRRDALFAPTVEQLDVALAKLASVAAVGPTGATSPEARAFQQAEAGLRETHAYMHTLWREGSSDAQTLATMTRAADLYRRHFVSAIMFADVLFREAEYVATTRHPLAAIPLYEQVIATDLQAKYSDQARERLDAIWAPVNAPVASPPPPLEPWPLSAEEAAWLAEAQATLDGGGLEPRVEADTRLRIATLHLAHGDQDQGLALLSEVARASQTDLAAVAATRYITFAFAYSPAETFTTVREDLTPERAPHLWTLPPFRARMLEIGRARLAERDAAFAYPLLRELAFSAQDEIAVDAGLAYIEYAAEHEDPVDFRLIRKDLQSNEFLWEQRRFRAALYTLKKQVEG